MLENKLNELNIFALRDLARKTGVNSPTSKKKEELIKGIVEIMSGKKEPVINKTKQGRPPKVFGYDFANVFNSNQSLTKLTLSQPSQEFSNEDVTTVAGWLEPVNNNAAILWVNKNLKNENFFIPKEVLNGLEVRSGDRVVAEVQIDENQQFIKKIFSINDCPINQFTNSRENYSSIEHCFVNKSLTFNKDEYNNLQLKVGGNIYVYGANNNDNTMTVVDMLNSCKIDNKIYLNISLAEKNKALLNNITNSETFVANIDDDIDTVRRLIALVIERAKRILEIGESVLVVVDDFLSISSVDRDNLNYVKKLASITKATENKGAITLLAIMPNDSLSQIEKLADERLKIENKIVLKKD